MTLAYLTIITRNLHSQLNIFYGIRKIKYLTTQQLGPGPHILAFTESYSNLGWMYKEPFDPNK